MIPTRWRYVVLGLLIGQCLVWLIGCSVPEPPAICTCADEGGGWSSMVGPLSNDPAKRAVQERDCAEQCRPTPPLPITAVTWGPAAWSTEH